MMRITMKRMNGRIIIWTINKSMMIRKGMAIEKMNGKMRVRKMMRIKERLIHSER